MREVLATYDRDNNVSGAIEANSFVPEYGSTVSFENKNVHFYTADNYYKKFSKGLNGAEIKFDLKFSNKTEEEAKSFLSFLEGVSRSNLGVLNFNQPDINGVELSFPTGDIYKNLSGLYIENYDFRFHDGLFDIDLIVSKNGYSSFLDWKESSYLNTENFQTGWTPSNSYEKFDIVYYPEYDPRIPTPSSIFSLRNLLTTSLYAGNVVDARRNSDGAEESFTADEVSDGTLEGWTLAPVSSIIGDTMYFDKVDDYISLNSPLTTPSGDWFIEFKLLLNDIEASGFRCIIRDIGISIIIWGENIYTDIVGSPGTSIQTSIIPYLNSITTVRLEVVGTTRELFLNGISVGSNSAGTPAISFENFGADENGTNKIGNAVLYDLNFNDQAYYQGRGNTNADWVDTIGTNHGTVNGLPALFTGQGINSTVSKWYNQSNEINYVAQTSPEKQPKIVYNGGLVLDKDGNASLLFDGVDDELNNLNGILPSNNSGAFCLVALFNEADGGSGYVCGSANEVGGGSSLYSTSSGFVLSDGLNISGDNYPNYNTNLTLAVANYDNNTVNLRANGADGGTNTFTYTFEISDKFTIGNSDGGDTEDTFFKGNITEIVVYNTTQLVNIPEIEDNIRRYYNMNINGVENKIEKFYYCSRDHISNYTNRPIDNPSEWTRTFFYDLDDDISISTDKKSEVVKLKDSFSSFAKTSANAGLIKGLTINLKNRSDKETRSIIHFIEKHEDYRPFELNLPQLYNQRKFFVCNSMQHKFVYKNCNDITLNLDEVIKFKSDSNIY